MQLRPENECIEIPGADAVRVLREIDLVVVSLHRIASYCAAADKFDQRRYEQETTRFVDQWEVTKRLAKIRGLLTSCFDLTLGKDEMDDVEREMVSVDYWTSPQSQPRSS